jgi:RNA polymerase sigma factor (sigma-70 family)
MSASVIGCQSLIERLKRSDLDQSQAWERFAQIFGPVLLLWARSRYGLEPLDAEDLVRDLLADLLAQRPLISFAPEQKVSRWAASLLHRYWLDRQRHLGRLPPGADESSKAWSIPGAERLSALERRLVVRRAFELVCVEFDASTWQACWAVAVEGKATGEVATKHNLTENAVYVAKLRVLRRLSKELDGMFE